MATRFYSRRLLLLSTTCFSFSASLAAAELYLPPPGPPAGLLTPAPDRSNAMPYVPSPNDPVSVYEGPYAFDKPLPASPPPPAPAPVPAPPPQTTPQAAQHVAPPPNVTIADEVTSGARYQSAVPVKAKAVPGVRPLIESAHGRKHRERSVRKYLPKSVYHTRRRLQHDRFRPRVGHFYTQRGEIEPLYTQGQVEEILRNQRAAASAPPPQGPPIAPAQTQAVSTADATAASAPTPSLAPAPAPTPAPAAQPMQIAALPSQPQPMLEPAYEPVSPVGYSYSSDLVTRAYSRPAMRRTGYVNMLPEVALGPVKPLYPSRALVDEHGIGVLNPPRRPMQVAQLTQTPPSPAPQVQPMATVPPTPGSVPATMTAPPQPTTSADQFATPPARSQALHEAIVESQQPPVSPADVMPPANTIARPEGGYSVYPEGKVAPVVPMQTADTMPPVPDEPLPLPAAEALKDGEWPDFPDQLPEVKQYATLETHRELPLNPEMFELPIPAALREKELMEEVEAIDTVDAPTDVLPDIATLDDPEPFDIAALESQFSPEGELQKLQDAPKNMADDIVDDTLEHIMPKADDPGLADPFKTADDHREQKLAGWYDMLPEVLSEKEQENILLESDSDPTPLLNGYPPLDTDAADQVETPDFVEGMDGTDSADMKNQDDATPLRAADAMDDLPPFFGQAMEIEEAPTEESSTQAKEESEAPAEEKAAETEATDDLPAFFGRAIGEAVEEEEPPAQQAKQEMAEEEIVEEEVIEQAITAQDTIESGVEIIGAPEVKGDVSQLEVLPAIAVVEPGDRNALHPSTRAILDNLPGGIGTRRASSSAKSFSLERLDPEIEDILNATPKGEEEEVRQSDASGISMQVKRPAFNATHELQKAYDALLAGETSLAVEIYKDVLRQDPNNQTALFGLATTFHRVGEIGNARPFYGKLLMLNPEHRDALNNFLVLVSEEAPEEALDQLKILQHKYPHYSQIPAQMALIYDQLGYPDLAKRHLLKAVTLSPENLVYKYNLAVMLDAQGELQEAAALYRQLIKAGRRGGTLPVSIDHIQERLTFILSNRL